MGGGSWTTSDFVSYSTSRGRATTSDGFLNKSYNAQDLYKVSYIQPELDPKNVIRECRDSEEHPNTIPVILALDVTGSMGIALAEVAKKLNKIMTELYNKVDDVEIMIMGIGDLAYDNAPIQASQFESDIRIAEQLDKLYFERGGGGNGYESYTASWYFGLRHTDLDCWKRSQKGIIITLGDEPLNPYLPKKILSDVTGDNIQSDLGTVPLYREAINKFDIYHIAIDDPHDSYEYYKKEILDSWGAVLDKQHFFVSNIDSLTKTIVDIVSNRPSDQVVVSENDSSSRFEIVW